MKTCEAANNSEYVKRNDISAIYILKNKFYKQIQTLFMTQPNKY